MKISHAALFAGTLLLAAPAAASEPSPLPLAPEAPHDALAWAGATRIAQPALTDSLQLLDTAPADDAHHDALAQYFPPDKTRPDAGDPPVYAGFGAAMNRPVRVGLSLLVGGSVPRNERGSLNEDEFAGTFDFGGGLYINVLRFISFDLGLRGGFGGLNTDMYEQRYRIPELNARHFHAGLHVRLHPFALGIFQPFVSVAGGVDRVMAVRHEPTGALICEDYGSWERCDEETERTFAAGYWGSSFGFGAGLLLDGNGEIPLSASFELMRTYNHYGRYTVTGAPSIDLGGIAPTVANTTFLFSLNILLF